MAKGILTACLLTVLLLVSLAAATTKDDSISPKQDTTWNSPNTQSISSTQGADYDPHDFVPEQYNIVRVIHAALMSLVFLLLFPFGGIIIRALHIPFVVKDIYIHAGIQMVAFWIFIAAAGMGIWMAKEIDQLHRYHPTIGLTMLALLSIQPATEILNSSLYHRHPKVIIAAHIHLWMGRGLLAAGLIQGGLGFLFAASFPKATVDMPPRMAYGLMAIVVYVTYVTVVVIRPEVRKVREVKRGRGERFETGVGRVQTRTDAWEEDGNGMSAGNGYYQVGHGMDRR